MLINRFIFTAVIPPTVPYIMCLAYHDGDKLVLASALQGLFDDLVAYGVCAALDPTRIQPYTGSYVISAKLLIPGETVNVVVRGKLVRVEVSLV